MDWQSMKKFRISTKVAYRFFATAALCTIVNVLLHMPVAFALLAGLMIATSAVIIDHTSHIDEVVEHEKAKVELIKQKLSQLPAEKALTETTQPSKTHSSKKDL